MVSSAVGCSLQPGLLFVAFVAADQHHMTILFASKRASGRPWDIHLYFLDAERCTISLGSLLMVNHALLGGVWPSKDPRDLPHPRRLTHTKPTFWASGRWGGCGRHLAEATAVVDDRVWHVVDFFRRLNRYLNRHTNRHTNRHRHVDVCICIYKPGCLYNLAVKRTCRLLVPRWSSSGLGKNQWLAC